MKTSNIINISILEDSEIHLRWILEKVNKISNFHVKSTNMSGVNGLASIRRHQPDVVIVDFQLKDITGLEFARKAKVFLPNIKIFSLTAHTELEILKKIVFSEYIDGIAIKGSDYFDDNFKKSIEDVYAGGSYIEPSILNIFRTHEPRVEAIVGLTKREYEVYMQSNFGKNNIEIASSLNVDVAHVANIKSKVKKKLNEKILSSF